MNNAKLNLCEEDLKQPPLPVEWLNSAESKKRIADILLRMEHSGSNRAPSMSKSDPLLRSLVKLVVFCHGRTVEKLNTAALNSAIPWDTRTKFPSHPTLVADAEVFTKVCRLRDENIRVIVRSF